MWPRWRDHRHLPGPQIEGRMDNVENCLKDLVEAVDAYLASMSDDDEALETLEKTQARCVGMLKSCGIKVTVTEG